MYFRFVNNVSFIVTQGDALQLRFGGPSNVRVTMTHKSYQDTETGENRHVEVTAQGDWELDPDATELFQHLAGGTLPPEFGQPELWVTAERQENGWVKRKTVHSKSGALGPLMRGMVPELQSLPPSTRDALAAIEKELADKSRSAVNVLRWRLGIRTSFEPLEDGLSEWSVNGNDWLVVPFSSNWWAKGLKFPRDALLTTAVETELQSLIDSHLGEPLAHGLFLEAWGHRERSPRSALVIGIAAAEVGFRHFLSEVASSMVSNQPLPQQLKTNLPRLLRNRIDLPSQSLPEQSILNRIEAACKARNTIAHIPPSEVARYEEATKRLTAELTSDLLAVSDLLWFLDYFSGQQWALDYVRKEAFREWMSQDASATSSGEAPA